MSDYQNRRMNDRAASTEIRKERTRMRKAESSAKLEAYRRIQRIVTDSLARGRPVNDYDRDEALLELEQERICAMTSYPAQMGAAVRATLAKMELCGLVIKREERGRPGDFTDVHSEDDLLRLIEERAGPQVGKAFQLFLEHLADIKVQGDNNG